MCEILNIYVYMNEWIKVCCDLIKWYGIAAMWAITSTMTARKSMVVVPVEMDDNRGVDAEKGEKTSVAIAKMWNSRAINNMLEET